MKKMALMTLPSTELERPPVAPALLLAVLKNNGFDGKIFDFNLFLNKNVDSVTWYNLEMYWRGQSETINNQYLERFYEVCDKYVEEIKEYKPDYMGISVFSKYSIAACIKFCEHVKPKLNCVWIAGGHGLDSRDKYHTKNKDNNIKTERESFGEFMLKNKLLDYYVVGDAERSLIELLNGNSDYPGINGTPPAMITDLDNYPFADYTNVYPKDYYYTSEPSTYITMTKGCVRKCTFCDIPDLYPIFSMKSADRVVQEIKYNFDRYGASFVQFTDSLINGSLKHYREVCEKLKELKKLDNRYDSIKYFGQFICRPMKDQNEKDWKLIADSGANTLITGFESYSQDVRYHMGKHYTNDDIDFQLEQQAYYNIKNIALFFIGYPTETLEDHEKNIEFLHKHIKKAKAGIINMVRWGFTGKFVDSTKITKKGGVEMIIDPEFKERIAHLPKPVRDIAIGFGWLNKKNPTLTLKERMRRRLELHDISVKLGWPQTKVVEELNMLNIIMKSLDDATIDGRHFEQLDSLFDIH